jgi:hypothetical protein
VRFQAIFELRGGFSIGDPQEDSLGAQGKYHAHPYVSWLHRSAELVLVAVIAFFLFAVPVPFGMYFGWTHPAPWACLLGLAMRHGLTTSQVIGLLRWIGGDRPKIERREG